MAKGHKKLLHSVELLRKELIRCKMLFSAITNMRAEDRTDVAAGHAAMINCNFELGCNDSVAEDMSDRDSGKSRCLCSTQVSVTVDFDFLIPISNHNNSKCINSDNPLL